MKKPIALVAMVSIIVFSTVCLAQSNRQYKGKSLEAAREPAILSQDKIYISFGSQRGLIRPLLGVNAGPLPAGESGNADLAEQYNLIGIDSVRTQDLYGPLDMSVMYPDINASPFSAASYNYVISNDAFVSIQNAGIEPYLRIGDSYNNVRIPQNNQERLNYINAAVEVVRHYRKGVLKGQGSAIDYVEIGNEPDNRHFWPGKYEDFFPLFAGIFKEIKKEYPELKVGGPGFVVASYKIPSARKNVTNFLDYLNEYDIKPDFVSFHLYSDNPAEFYDIVLSYREQLDNAGMQDTELHITEWNTESSDAVMRTGAKAAPYLSACWIALQDAQIDRSFFFRGNDTNVNLPNFYGLFYADGRKKPSAYAMYLWSLLSAYTKKVDIITGIEMLDDSPQLVSDIKPLWMVAGINDEGETGFLVSNIGYQTLQYELDVPAKVNYVEVMEISSPYYDVQTYMQHAASLSIGPLAVQFVRIKPY